MCRTLAWSGLLCMGMVGTPLPLPPPPSKVTKFLCCATIIAIIQYCNFCQLSFWMRSVLATAAGAALLLLLSSPLYRPG